MVSSIRLSIDQSRGDVDGSWRVGIVSPSVRVYERREELIFAEGQALHVMPFVCSYTSWQPRRLTAPRFPDEHTEAQKQITYPSPYMLGFKLIPASKIVFFLKHLKHWMFLVYFYWTKSNQAFRTSPGNEVLKLDMALENWQRDPSLNPGSLASESL